MGEGVGGEALVVGFRDFVEVFESFRRDAWVTQSWGNIDHIQVLNTWRTWQGHCMTLCCRSGEGCVDVSFLPLVGGMMWALWVF